MNTNQTRTLLQRIREFLRPTGYMATAAPIDRDAERISAELAALY